MFRDENDDIDEPVAQAFGLPKEIVNHTFTLAVRADDYHSIATTQVMAKVSETCKGMHTLFKPELDRRGVEYLLNCVLQVKDNEMVKAIVKMAKKNPALFFIKATANDYARDLDGNCRTLEDWSPYQALFGTGDIDLLEKVKPHLDVYLKTLPGDEGNELAYNQEQEKFPDGLDFPESTYDFNRIAQTVDADVQLANTGIPNAATLAALAQFKADFKPGIVKVGHHFNMNDFIKAWEVYNQNWNPWSEEQLEFFSQKIIGFLERLLTAPYQQRNCQGVANSEKPLKRSFEIKNYVNGLVISVYPLDSDPTCRLGEHFVIDSLPGLRLAALRARCGHGHVLFLENYVKQTLQRYQNLCTHRTDKKLRV